MPSIVGTWKLVRAVARDGGGATLPEPYGGKGIGRVTFTADGRMQSMVCDGRKEMPVGVARDYSSYCGNYTFDGTRLVTRVDAASDPSRLGSDQVRGATSTTSLSLSSPSTRINADTFFGSWCAPKFWRRLSKTRFLHRKVANAFGCPAGRKCFP